MLLGEHQHGAREDGHATLEVDRAASVHVIVLDLAGKWIDAPFLSLDAHHVGMRRDENRTLRAVTLESRDEVRLSGIRRRNDLHVEAPSSEAWRENLRDAAFIAR